VRLNKYLKKSHPVLKAGANPNAKAVFPFYARNYMVETTTPSLAVFGNKCAGGDIRIVSPLLAKDAKKCEFERMSQRAVRIRSLATFSVR
jgi:hypothetical protein